MGDPATDIGITWEQIAIAAVCFVVLVIVLIASLRGIGRGRRKARLLRETTREPVYRPRSAASPAREDRRAERRPAAADDIGRMEPSLLRSEEPSARIRIGEEEAPLEPEPLPDFDPTALEQHLAYLSETQADMARTLKGLKANVDELRKAEAENTQRLDETEQVLGQLRAESHTAFALLEKIADQATAAAAPESRTPKRKRPSDPSLPLDMPSAEPASDDDPSVARAREAIEQLERQDRGKR